MHGARRFGLLLALLAVAGCSSDSPEEQIRARIAEAETAATSGDLRTLRGFVSPQYTDGEGRDKSAIDGLMAYHLMRNRSVHVLTRVRSIKLVEHGRAQVGLFVAVAASPISGPGALGSLDAELLHVDLEVRSSSGADWKITGARWRRAEPADFL